MTQGPTRAESAVENERRFKVLLVYCGTEGERVRAESESTDALLAIAESEQGLWEDAYVMYECDILSP